MDRFTPIDDAVIVAERQVHHGTDDHLSVHGDRAFLDAVKAEDAHLGRIEDRGAEQRTEDAAVGDGKGTAAQIFQGEGPILRSLGKVADLSLDLGKGHATGVAQHRHDQAFFGADGNTDIVVILEQDFIALNFGVQPGEGFEGADDGFDEEGHEPELDAVFFAEGVLAAFAQLDHGGHIDIVEGGQHSGGLLGFHQAAGDGAAAARHANALFGALGCAAGAIGGGGRPWTGFDRLNGSAGPSRWAGFSRRSHCVRLNLWPGFTGLDLRSGFDEALHVLFGHPLPGAARGDLIQVNALGLGQAAGDRRGPPGRMGFGRLLRFYEFTVFDRLLFFHRLTGFGGLRFRRA